MKTLKEFGIYILSAVLLDVIAPGFNISYIAGYLAIGVLGGLIIKNSNKKPLFQIVGGLLVAFQLLGLYGASV